MFANEVRSRIIDLNIERVAGRRSLKDLAFGNGFDHVGWQDFLCFGYDVGRMCIHRIRKMVRNNVSDV